ncbi:MAG: ABC transporter permease [Lachnospiraceae bacterium]|nr:ABC transporter permease [Lachnospiraceae bacterium]
MKGFIGLTKRNLLIYFKDIQAVIFSLLTSIIVLVLYLLFLKGTFVDAIESSVAGLENFILSDDIDTLANLILLVGIIGSALITVPYNCLSTVISDREKKIDYDICATPVKRWQIALSYFTAATLSAFIMASIILSVGLLVLSSTGSLYMGAIRVLVTYGLIFLGSVSATAFFMMVVLFFKTTSASGAFFGILSAASGFVIGAFIPLSEFSNSVQTACNLFPASHVTILFRNALLNGILDKMNDDLGGIDNGFFRSGIKESFTFNANIFEHSLSCNQMVAYIIAATILSVIGLIFIFAKTYKKK